MMVVLFVLGILCLVAGVVLIFSLGKKSGTTHDGVAWHQAGESIKVRIGVPCIAFVLAIIFIFASFVNVMNPGSYGLGYQLNGTAIELKVGYNFLPAWSRINIWDATAKLFTFSQGEAADDIYGAQTSEKDFIQAVATLSAAIDTERMEEYIAMFGNEQISSQRVELLLKTLSREAIESSINPQTTAWVMANKKKVSDEAKEYLLNAIKHLPIKLVSFTLDDLIAPESYETAIREQAQLRMDREKATLQQQINQEQAEADKVKAEGDATVKKTQAQAEADVKKLQAENEAAVAKLTAENEAAVAKIQAENEAEVKKVQAQAAAEVKRIDAEATATEITTKANAEAEALIAQGEAEAKAIAAQGEAYKQNPTLIELKLAEIKAEVEAAWASKWSGYSFEGMSGFNFADMTDILKGLIPSTNVPAEVIPAK